MSLGAHVDHVTTGRMRLRVPGAKRDPSVFRRIERVLRECPAVLDVAVNPATASVVVRHRGDVREIFEHARAQGLFDMQQERPVRCEVLDGVRDALTGMNEAVRDRTRGAADLRTLGFVALLGGSMYQLVRGNFLPAGGTLLVQALDVLFNQHRAE